MTTKEKDYSITKKQFLTWLISDSDDTEYWGKRFIEELKQNNEIAITTEELFAERAELPAHLFNEGDDGDIPISEIELTHTSWEEEYEKCVRYPIYFFENYCTINGSKPSTATIRRLNLVYNGIH